MDKKTEILVNSYIILVKAKVVKIEDVPETLKTYVSEGVANG